MNYDYGHAKFLDALQGQKATVIKALERLERRTAEVMYEGQKWYSWVRQCQDEEEASREKEQKKVKMEAAMFRRNWKAAETRMKERREREDKRRQDAFLEKVYKERLREKERGGEWEETDDDMDWDPIEDVLEDSRGSFVGMLPFSMNFCCAYRGLTGCKTTSLRVSCGWSGPKMRRKMMQRTSPLKIPRLQAKTGLFLKYPNLQPRPTPYFRLRQRNLRQRRRPSRRRKRSLEMARWTRQRARPLNRRPKSKTFQTRVSLKPRKRWQTG
jgi:hypothetical protein